MSNVKLTFTLQFNPKSNYTDLSRYYNYFLNQYGLEGAYFYYRDYIIYIDVFYNGMNYLNAAENRFSLNISQFVTLFFYTKNHHRINHYFKQISISQVYKNIFVYAIPLNWFSPEQVISAYAFTKTTMLDTKIQIFSTGYTVTSLISNLDDPDLYALGAPIEFYDTPTKLQPNGQIWLEANTAYFFKNPTLIEAILIYPQSATTLEDRLTVEPFPSGGPFYFKGDTVIDNSTGIFNQKFFNVQLSNVNVINKRSAYLGATFPIDMCFYTKRALLGLDNLYFKQEGSQLIPFTQIIITNMPFGYFNTATNQIMPSNRYKYLDINFQTSVNETFTFIPYFQNIDQSKFVFWAFNSEGISVKWRPGNNTTNRLIVNIDLEGLIINEFYYYPGNQQQIYSITNDQTQNYPLNGPLSNNTFVNTINYPDALNVSNDTSLSNQTMFFNFISNTWTFSSNSKTGRIINAANSVNWQIRSIAYILKSYNYANTYNIWACDATRRTNFIFMRPEAILPYYYFSTDIVVDVTIRLKTRMTKNNSDSYYYSESIYLPTTQLQPKFIAINSINQITSLQWIETNLNIKRNIEWYPCTFYLFDKNQFIFKQVDKNPFNIRIQYPQYSQPTIVSDFLIYCRI